MGLENSTWHTVKLFLVIMICWYMNSTGANDLKSLIPTSPGHAWTIQVANDEMKLGIQVSELKET